MSTLHPLIGRPDRSLTDQAREANGFTPLPIVHGPTFVPAPIVGREPFTLPVTRMRQLSAGTSDWFARQAEMTGRVGSIGYARQSVEADDSSDRYELTDEQYRAETMTTKVDRRFGMAIATRAAVLMTGARPVILAGRKSRGGVEQPDLHTGKARLETGQVVSLEAWADRILAAANAPTDRPDVPRLITDPFTLADRWESTVRPDRVAWRGKRRARIRTHTRARIGGQAATVAVTSRRYWPDVTSNDPSETLAWRQQYAHALVTSLVGVADADVTIGRPMVKRAAIVLPDRNSARRNARRITRRFSAFQSVHVSNVGDDSGQARSASETSAYGRPVTPWSASARSLARMVNRHGLAGIVDTLAQVVRTSATDRPVPLVGATVRVSLAVRGKRAVFLVDDGAHGAQPVTEWAARAALDGVTA